MAYITGTASNMTELRTAIFNACTANGWTLSGEVLHKGASYFRLQVVSGDLTLLGGNGKDGSNNLTDAGPFIVRIANFVAAAPLAYPMTYHIHIGATPDEVYVVVNYSTDYFQWCAFGRSSLPLAAGSGNWYAASAASSNNSNGAGIRISAENGGTSTYAYPSGAFFWQDSTGASAINSFIHHGLEAGWSGTSGRNTVGGAADAITGLAPLMAISPNASTGEGLLLPIPILVARSSGRYSLAAQPAHARFVRIDNFSPGQVVTIGPDSWKVYPWLKKDVVNRTGTVATTGDAHSGTFGWALRYTP